MPPPLVPARCLHRNRYRPLHISPGRVLYHTHQICGKPRHAPTYQSQKYIKARHEAVYIEQSRNRKAVRIPFEIVKHIIRNQRLSLKRSMMLHLKTAMSLKLEVPPSVISLSRQKREISEITKGGVAYRNRSGWAEPMNLYKRRLHVLSITSGFTYVETSSTRWRLKPDH